MTRDDVFWLMQEVGASGISRLPNDYEGFVDVFERFAKIVVGKEHEAILSLAKEQGWAMKNEDPFEDYVSEICNMRSNE